jgi:hypothetical protein
MISNKTTKTHLATIPNPLAPSAALEAILALATARLAPGPLGLAAQRKDPFQRARDGLHRGGVTLAHPHEAPLPLVGGLGAPGARDDGGAALLEAQPLQVEVVAAEPFPDEGKRIGAPVGQDQGGLVDGHVVLDLCHEVPWCLAGRERSHRRRRGRVLLWDGEEGGEQGYIREVGEGGRHL